MRNEIAAALLLTALVAGCGTDAVESTPKRTWQLTRDGVLAGSPGSTEGRRVSIPGWVYASELYACPPVMALGPGGEAIVTSNVLPTLWRIDPRTLAVTEHPLALDADEGRDEGFTAIVYSAEHAAYFAFRGNESTLWKIDPQLRRAQKIQLSEPLARVCGLTMRSGASAQKAFRHPRLCAIGAEGRWRIDLAPDQRAAYPREASLQECPVSAAELALRKE
jgi:hypothetical protein